MEPETSRTVVLGKLKRRALTRETPQVQKKANKTQRRNPFSAIVVRERKRAREVTLQKRLGMNGVLLKKVGGGEEVVAFRVIHVRLVGRKQEQ